MSTYESIPPFSRYGQGDAHMSPWQLYKNSGWDTDLAPFSGLMGPVFNVKAFGATGLGVVNERTAFADGLTRIRTAGGGVLYVPYGIYDFTISGDSDTLLPPSNCRILCQPGTILRWSELGSPLFCCVNVDTVTFENAMFEWDGTLADVAGSNTNRFGWTGSLPNRDLCAHVLSLGSNNVKIRGGGCRTVGDAPTLATQCVMHHSVFAPKQDGTTLTYGNGVTDCWLDDALIAVLIVSQDGFTFSDIFSRRYPGDHPVGGGIGLNGHLIYASDNGVNVPSRVVVVDNVKDLGVEVGSLTSPRSDSSVQLKSCVGPVVSNVTSKRKVGMMSLADITGGTFTGMTWTPSAIPSGAGISSAVLNSIGVKQSVFRGLTFILPDNTDFKAFSFSGLVQSSIEALISASHTTDSIASTELSTSDDNDVSITYVARNTTTCQVINLGANGAASRNVVRLIPVGANHKLRPFVVAGSANNVILIRDNVLGKWSERSWWTTESDSPAMGFESIKKSKVFRIGTLANPTTTFQLARAGVWFGTVQVIEASGAHLLGGLYRITWDAGALQSVELLGTQWTVGASAPTVLGLAVSNAGVVTVTTTAGAFSWDIVYDFQSLGNNRYADY